MQVRPIKQGQIASGVSSWEVSTSLDTSFCLSALDRALKYGRPEIFNTDQGAQFTSKDFTRAVGSRKHTDQHGRSRASPGQRIRGKAMAVRQVREHLSSRLSKCRRGHSWYRSLLQILQQREFASGALVSDTGGRMVSRGLAFAQRAVKGLRSLRGVMLVPRTTSLTARLAAAKYSVWAAAAAPFQWQGSTLTSPLFCPTIGDNLTLKSRVSSLMNRPFAEMRLLKRP